MVVRYFIDKNNNNFVKDFLDENPKIMAKAFRLFKNIEEFGLTSVISHIKKLSGLPLWEIRILGKDSVRILYVNKIKEEIVLLHAFKKKTNKTPFKEITIALNRLKQIS